MKTLFFILGLIIFSSFSLAEPFNPTLLKLSIPEEIAYSFDGSPLTIPVTVTGTPAALWLVINTKGQADNIIGVKNGFLGWHYVNKIDTTIYISTRYDRDPGETTITWDGIDENGNLVVSGTYDYFIWGYDYKSNRQLVSRFAKVGYGWDAQYSQIYDLGEDGLPLSHPIIMGNIRWMMSYAEKDPTRQHGVHYKWTIGNDPLDKSLLQTTRCSIYSLTPLLKIAPYYAVTYGGPILDPNDHDIFYHCCLNMLQESSTVLKWRFVTNGEAVLDEDWLGWDRLVWDEYGLTGGDLEPKATCFTDNKYIYLTSVGDKGPSFPGDTNFAWNQLRCVSFDGDIIFDKDMKSWRFKDEPLIPQPDGKSYYNRSESGKFGKMYSRGNNRWLFIGTICCLLQMIDTTRLLIDQDDETDMVVFENRNGDYFLDVGYLPDIEPSWYCIGSTPNYSFHRTSVCIDSNNFNVIYVNFPQWDSSFAVLTQDGTGIDYMAFADDPANRTWTNNNKGGLIVDIGSDYDGLYITAPFSDNGKYTDEDNLTSFIAFDSCHGVITNNPTLVGETNLLQFTVEQNSPNPFNPSTVIRFTIPEHNRVTIDIYNIAGQKVQTLVNDVMNARTHSVIWDAGKYPSGVYVYRVRSGKFEKTMKMTLVK